jgi:hypothetical protein
MAHFKIYVAQSTDVNQGWIWLGSRDLPHRTIVRLSARDTGGTVYCEALSIDDNFLRSYNRPPRITITDPLSALVVAEWYRKCLRLEARTEAEIDVEPANHLFGKLHACLDHPQIVVRIAVILGMWSVVLGFIGIVLGFVALFK